MGEIDVELPRAETREYPHAILHDFESYGDKNQRKELTKMLTIENVHVPISVSVGDTLDLESTHICEKDPVELVRKFMEELERRGGRIRAKVQRTYMPVDIELLPKVQRLKIEEWCDQVPVVGFNSGSYDLNLIKGHFAERLADTTGKTRAVKSGNEILFLLTKGFASSTSSTTSGREPAMKRW